MIRWHRFYSFLGCCALAGCGGEAASDYAPLDEPSNAEPLRAAHTPCAEGRTASCQHIIGQHAGITNCYDGLKTCVGGAWSACEPIVDAMVPDASAPDTQPDASPDVP